MELTSAARSLLRRFSVSNSHKAFSTKHGAATAALVTLAAMAMTGAQATTGVGATPGSGGVSATGAATYVIPISVPPGTHGMQPSLALTYNSQGGDGLAGYGWTLAGFSAISRCNENFDDNGYFQAVQIAPAGNTSDNFCLDGQRLRYVSGPYGGDGSTYRTEINNYSIITSHGSAGNGPSWFTVQTKDGRTYEYGNTSGSKILFQGTSSARTWALDKVTDPSGNVMAYQYTQSSAVPGSEYWPASILYTANGSTAADHEIDFTFVQKSEGMATRYQHGSLTANTKLLSAISIKYAGSVTHSYTLAYSNDSATFRNQLTSVTECGLNSDCLPATTISWTQGQAGWNAGQSTGVSVADAAHAMAAHLMDVDGDGIDDLVYPDTTSNDWEVMFGQPGGGFTAPVDTGIGIWHTANYYQFALAMDYNGDGKMDLIMPIPTGWLVMVATGNRTAGAGGIFLTPGNSIPYMGNINSVTGLPVYEGNVWMADFSGGQLADMFDTDGTAVHWQQNNGPANSESFNPPVTVLSGLTGASSTLKNFINPDFVDVGLDFDGSGRAGALLLSTTGTTGTWFAMNTTPGNTLAEMDSVGGTDPTVSALPIDANGDGLTDLMTVTTGEKWQLSLSEGAQFSTVSTSLSYESGTNSIVADYFGDGKQAAIVASLGTWYVLDVSYNASQGAFSLSPVAVTAPPSQFALAGSLRVGKIEANGLDDLIYASPTGGSTYTFYYALHAGYNSTPGDLVTQVTDGFGNVNQFQYTSLASGSPTYTQSDSPSYPTRLAASPMQVVSLYTQSAGTVSTSGVHGKYSLAYTYANAEMDTQGHGFLGFGSRTIVDGRSGDKETISYYQAFPFTGMVQQDLLNTSNGTQLDEIDNNDWDYAEGASDYVFFGNRTNNTDAYYPFFDTSEHYHYEVVSGTNQVVSDTRTIVVAPPGGHVTDAFDTFGNLTDQRTVVTDDMQGGAQYITEQKSTYPTPGANNCSYLPGTVTISRTTPGGSATRTVTNAVDGTNCRLNSRTIADSANTVSLTTAYPSYDSFGNVTEEDVSGTGIPATRVTTYRYQAGNNEFPISVTHVVSAADSITSASIWNYAFGVKSSDTDPNGNQTVYTTDDFGRPATVTRPDGSKTSLAYSWCSGTPCPYNAEYEITTNLASGISGAQGIITDYATYDTFGRPVAQASAVLGGNFSVVGTIYNSLGDVAAVSKPYISNPTTGGSPQYETIYTYDFARNRVNEIDAPQDAADTCTSLSPVTCPNKATTTVTYGGVVNSGFMVTTTHTVTNSASSSSIQKTSKTTDALGEVLNTMDAANGPTSFSYDAFGDLVSTQDADNKLTTMSYDGLGHKTGMVDPNMGTWNYQVDALGEILCQTDAKGQSIIMAYDNVGRLTSKLETAAGAGCSATSGTSSAWAYDTQTKGIGLPATVTDSNGFERDYDYDSLSRPSDVTTTPGAGTSQYTVSTTYDNLGRVQTVTYPTSAAPSAPVAVAKATPTAIVTNGSITLDGTVSTDPYGLPLQYSWTYVNNDNNATIANPTAATTTVSTLGGDSYTFQLVVSDGNASSSPVTVTVTSGGAPPRDLTVSPNPNFGSFNLTWSGGGHYAVYMSTDGTNYTLVTTVHTIGAGPSNYAGSASVAGNVLYTVANCDTSWNCGPMSLPVVIQVQTPPTPSSLSLTPVPSYGSYTLSWSDTASVTFNIYESYNGGAYSLAASTTSKSYTFNKTQTGTYSYYIFACGPICSSASNTVTETVSSASVPPGTPSSITAQQGNCKFGGSCGSSITMNTDQSFSLIWGSASGSVGYYQVNATPAGAPGGGTFAASKLSESVTEPNAGTFHFTVQACNQSGCSAPTSSVTVTVQQGITMTNGQDPEASLAVVEQNYESKGEGAQDSFTRLSQLRANLVAKLPLQSSEAQFQAATGRAEWGQSLALLAAPSKSDVAAWNARQDHKPGTPTFAPPVYIAYSDAQVKRATSTPYRFSVQYNYDPNSDLLQSVTNTATGFTYWQAATQNGGSPMDAWGHIVGYVDGNNVSTVSAYDAATGAVQGISTGTGASSAVQSLIYTWDGFGNLKQRCDTNRGLAENFGYDNLNRIASSTVSTGATYGSGLCSGGTPQSTLGMQYDAVGNIQGRTNTGITVGSGTLNDQYAYGDPNHPYAVTGVTSMPGTYAYDANGNMTSGNGRTITWNDDNLPVSIASSGTVNGNNTVTGSSTFAYSPDLQRYSQVTTDSIAGNSTTTYIGGLFELVSSGGTTQYRHNIVADGGVVAVHTVDQSGKATTGYIHADHLGSSDTITNDSGAIVQQASFDAFGLRRNPNDWSYNLSAAQIAVPDPANPTISNLKGITDKGYTAQEQLDSVGLVHMNGRVYDPSIGRFISADPRIPNPLYSQAYDRYAYVYNNPLAMTDPSGYDGCGDTVTCIQTDPPADDPLPILTPSPDITPTSLSKVLPPFTMLGSHIPGVDTGCKACDMTLTRGGIDPRGSASGSQGADGSSSTANGSSGNPSGTAFLGKIDVSAQCDSICLAAKVSGAMQWYFNVRELAALGFAEAGVDYPLAPDAIIGSEWTVRNRVEDVGFPNTYDKVIHQPSAFAAIDTPRWTQAFNPDALSGAALQQYNYALAVATGILNGTIPDPTQDATFFYSGMTPPATMFAPNIASGRFTPTLQAGTGKFQMTFLTDNGP